MTTNVLQRAIPKKKRQEVFAALVEAQDQGMSVGQSRDVICKRFAISSEQLLDIEREGLTEEWPPLKCES